METRLMANSSSNRVAPRAQTIRFRQLFTQRTTQQLNHLNTHSHLMAVLVDVENLQEIHDSPLLIRCISGEEFDELTRLD